MSHKQLPIAVFDSGVGGLTVLKSLQQHLPNESFIYLGDTARLPYGSKSQVTISKYVQNASNFLIKQGAKMLVIACNTATALALPDLNQKFTNIPIIGTLEPGAEVACRLSKNGCIAVIATEATVRAEAYQQAIQNIRPHVKIFTQSCPLFVALAEEGWANDPITEVIARRYLEPLLFHNKPQPDCLLLGCTHFPLLTQTIARISGDNIALVDSAETTAIAVKTTLNTLDLHNETLLSPTSLRLLVTDSPQRFARIAKQFLQRDIVEQDIELIETTLD